LGIVGEQHPLFSLLSFFCVVFSSATIVELGSRCGEIRKELVPFLFRISAALHPLLSGKCAACHGIIASATQYVSAPVVANDCVLPGRAAQIRAVAHTHGVSGQSRTAGPGSLVLEANVILGPIMRGHFVYQKNVRFDELDRFAYIKLTISP
jgi:hypothetical protein